MYTMFDHFVTGLYKHPWLSRTIFVLFVERNLPCGPYVVEQVMENKYPRHYIITDAVRGVSGWWTDRHMKTEYVISGAEQLREGKLAFLQDMVCKNPWMDPRTRAAVTREKLLEQIPRFRLRDPTPGTSRSMPIMSGKIDENGRQVKGMKDDMAFSLFMTLYMVDKILKESIPGFDYSYIKQETSNKYY